MVFCAPKPGVSMHVAGGDDRVVPSRRGVFFQDQNGPSPVRRQPIALGREDALKGRVQMVHRHELGHVVGIEAPGIDNLLTMRVDDLDALPLRETHCPAAPGRNNLKIHLRHPVFAAAG